MQYNVGDYFGELALIRNQLQALFQPTDNKLAMKLFGSKKALMKERIRQKAAGHWIIHPCSNFRWVDVRFHPLVCTAHPRRPLAANKKKNPRGGQCPNRFCSTVH